MADKYDLTRKTHCSTEVSSAHWDEALGLWHVYTRPARGETTRGNEDKHWVCKVLVSGVGGLSQREWGNDWLDAEQSTSNPLLQRTRARSTATRSSRARSSTARAGTTARR